MAITTQNGAPDSFETRSYVIADREKTCALIIFALANAPLRVILDVNDDTALMLALLNASSAYYTVS